MRTGSLLVVLLAALGCSGPPSRVASSEVRVDPSAAPTPDTALSETQQARWKEATLRTNTSKASLLAAADAENVQAAEPFLVAAVAGYRGATLAWQAALEAGGSPRRRAEARFWLADAWNKLIRTVAVLHVYDASRYQEPSPEEVQRALAAAVAARDIADASDFVGAASDFAVYASEFVVLAADIAVQLDVAHGVALRTAPEMEGPPGAETVKVMAIPAALQVALDARDQYARRVPAATDPTNWRGTKTGTLHQFEAAMTYYDYGHFAEARSRFDAVYQSACGVNDYGFRAWQLLVDIAMKSRDPSEAKRLADAEARHSCAMPGGY